MNVTEQHFHAVLIKYCAVQDTRDDKPRKYIFFSFGPVGLSLV